MSPWNITREGAVKGAKTQLNDALMESRAVRCLSERNTAARYGVWESQVRFWLILRPSPIAVELDLEA